MQTSFTLAQLADPHVAEFEGSCAPACIAGSARRPARPMCCSATSSIARGRIYLIKDMLENDRRRTDAVVKHIDRCLSCLACMTTCPSGVHYMHLVDHARVHIERPIGGRADRLRRCLLGRVLPDQRRFRRACARPGSAAAGRVPRRDRSPRRHAAAGARDLPRAGRCRAASAGGPAAPRPGRAVGRLREPGDRPLRRRGGDPRPQSPRGRGGDAEGQGLLRLACPSSRPRARGLGCGPRQCRCLDRRDRRGGLDAILITASGCGTSVKDYGFMLRTDRPTRTSRRVSESPWTSASIWRGC